jgi:hypothetical protein
MVVAPIIKLTNAITRLTTTMENLKKSVEDLTVNNQRRMKTSGGMQRAGRAPWRSRNAHPVMEDDR